MYTKAAVDVSKVAGWDGGAGEFWNLPCEGADDLTQGGLSLEELRQE